MDYISALIVEVYGHFTFTSTTVSVIREYQCMRICTSKDYQVHVWGTCHAMQYRAIEIHTDRFCKAREHTVYIIAFYLTYLQESMQQ